MKSIKKKLKGHKYMLNKKNKKNNNKHSYFQRNSDDFSNKKLDRHR